MLREHEKEMSYVDVEVCVVDVKSVGGLLKVDMGNAVGADVVIFNDTESGIFGNRLDELGGCLEVVGALDEPEARLGRSNGGVHVLGSGCETEGIDVNGTARKSVSMGGRVGCGESN